MKKVLRREEEEERSDNSWDKKDYAAFRETDPHSQRPSFEFSYVAFSLPSVSASSFLS